MSQNIIKNFNSFHKDHVMIKWAFLIMSVLFMGGLSFGYYKMLEAQTRLADRVVVIDRNNSTYIGTLDQISLDRRRGQLQRHVEMFYQLFWNVSQSRDDIDISTNAALELIDESGLNLYEKYYEIQDMRSFLYEHSARSYIIIEDVEIDMTSYPYEGLVKAVQEIETNYGSTKRRMDAVYRIKNYAESYENPVGAMLLDFEIVNDEPIDDEE